MPRSPRAFADRRAAAGQTTARNIAISRLRHQKVVDRSKTAVTVSEELRIDVATTEHEVSRHMQHQALMLAVNSLPPKCRSVIVLRMIHGMSQRAIAEELGIAVSTVEKHLANGLRLCKAQLAADPIEVDEAAESVVMTGTAS